MNEKANAIAEAQGWNNNSLLDILADFITQNSLENRLAAYMQERADEENLVQENCG